MTGRRYDLIGLGECMVEFYADAPLGKAEVLTRAYGGDVLNTLVMTARLGGRTGFISRVGNDPFGPGLLQAWRNEGVDTIGVALVDGDNGVYFISLLANGEREFTYRRRDTPASRMGPADLDEDYIASAGCILLSGISQALSLNMQRTTLVAAQLARQHGVLVAYDPNYRPKLWAQRGGVRAARRALRELLPFTDILLPSFPTDTALLDRPARTEAQAARAFSELCGELALKCGAQGCEVVTGKQCIHIDAQQVAQVVDTTGAGDAWNGAYLLHRLRNATATQAATEANRIAALKLAHRGAVPDALRGLAT